MSTLVLNAAEGRVQLALLDDGEAASAATTGKAAKTAESPLTPRILYSAEIDAPSRGTELLPPAVDTALRTLDMTPRDIQRIACVHGPGSFTGLRLVLAFAAAFRRAVNAELGGINYLQALAESLPHMPGAGLPELRRVLTHARRDLVHRQDFMAQGSTVGTVPVSEPEMVDLEHALDGLTRPALVMGSGYVRNRAVLGPKLPSGTLPVLDVVQPSLGALARLAAAADYARRDLDPLYLRPCDAVDNLPHIAAKRGERAEDALKRLDALMERPVAPEE